MEPPFNAALLVALLDASFDEIYVTDARGVTLWVNKACERFYGLPASQLIGRSVHELEAQGVFSPSLTARVLREGRKLSAVQTTRSGRKLLVTSMPVTGTSGALEYVISNSRDITESMVLAERLSDAEELLQHYAAEVQRLRAGALGREPDGLVAVSPALQRVLATLAQVARVDSTVLITGETGVGKTAAARRLHQLSPRHQGPFVELNCATIPETLLESELFGYEKGAFTGARKEGKAGMVAMAEGGTLFLDEISEMPLHLQAKLLQLIQERQYYRIGGTRKVAADIRIVAATNRDLRQMAQAGEFRKDLYYRLNVVPVQIPPLRQRPEDIPPLLARALAACAQRYGIARSLSPAAAQRLIAYAWPGNVRELENMVERLVLTTTQAVIEPADLPEEVWDAAAPPPGASPAPEPPAPAAAGAPQPGSVRLKASIEQMERELLQQALREHGSTHKLARVLGISQSSAVRKLKKYGLSS